ncbi:MAG: type II toxin-antitoxin system RelE/ParE family toxin [Thermotogaceae bacterium]|nr:type II toxin-antitoxin system RelE/ParE family toxin [Thermotogaceae bacterium]
MWTVEYYETDKKSCPVKGVIDSLPSPKMQAKALQDIGLLESLGSEMREPFSKPIGSGLFKLSIQFSSNIVRILYFFFYGKRIVLTNEFIKKTNRTLQREIEYKTDYERRVRT